MGVSFKDLTGQRFGKLVAISFVRRPSGKDGRSKIYWTCKCDCGNTTEVNSGNIGNGHTSSCGCLMREIAVSANVTHGLTGTRVYDIWVNMIARTKNIKNNDYRNYGARGISVCDRWLTFVRFKEDMYSNYLLHASQFGEENTSIERVDNSKGYSPDNCTWSTRIEQGQNKRNNKRYLVNGELLTRRDISAIYKISINTLKGRTSRGCSAEQMIASPNKNLRKGAGAKCC